MLSRSTQREPSEKEGVPASEKMKLERLGEAVGLFSYFDKLYLYLDYAC